MSPAGGGWALRPVAADAAADDGGGGSDAEAADQELLNTAACLLQGNYAVSFDLLSESSVLFAGHI